MQQHSKHLSEFNSNQILQIVKWAREKCKVNAKTVEDDLTLIRTEIINGTEYLKEINVAGVVINPVKLNC